MKKCLFIFTIVILTTMAIQCKKDQPIPAGSNPGDCDCGNGEEQIYAQDGDITQVQFGLDELFEDMNLISNGNFASASGWTLGTGWSIATGFASFSPGVSDGSISRELDYELTEGYYSIEFDINAAPIVFALEVFIGGALIPAGLIGTISGTYTGVSRFRLYRYLTAAEILNNTIEFGGFVGTGDFAMDNVVVKRLSEVVIELRDCDTDEPLYELDYSSGAIEYFNTQIVVLNIGEDNNTNPTVNQTGAAVVSFDWAALGIEPGCYCICFKDSALIGFNMFRNPGFDSADFWDIVNGGLDGWEITGGQAVHNPEIVGGNDVISQEFDLPVDPNLCYELRFDVIDAGAWSLQINIVLPLGIGLDPISGSGNTTYTIPISGSEVLEIQFQAGATNDSAIDNVFFGVAEECVPCSCRVFSVNYKASHDDTFPGYCNMLLTAENDADAFGLNYTDFDYKMSLRVFGKIRNSRYSYPDEDQYWTSAGQGTLVNARRLKSVELQIHELPESLHDCISLMVIHHHFKVTVGLDTVEYMKKPGDFSPQWRKSSNKAFVITDLYEKDQDKFNSLIGT